MPNTLLEASHYELVVRKSRFLATVEPVDDRRQALQVVERRRAEHTNANHVCWALLAGHQSAAVDDGEPSGTAGRPMMDVMRHHDLDGVLASVVRYFGGIKLGAGGLSRAYREAVAKAVAGGAVTAVNAMSEMRCSLAYPLEGVVRRLAASQNVQLVHVEHSSVVTFTMQIEQAAEQSFMAQVNEVSNGAVVWLE